MEANLQGDSPIGPYRKITPGFAVATPAAAAKAPPPHTLELRVDGAVAVATKEGYPGPGLPCELPLRPLVKLLPLRRESPGLPSVPLPNAARSFSPAQGWNRD